MELWRLPRPKTGFHRWKLRPAGGHTTARGGGSTRVHAGLPDRAPWAWRTSGHSHRRVPGASKAHYPVVPGYGTLFPVRNKSSDHRSSS